MPVTTFGMPEMDGDGDGELVAWLVEVGEEVAADQPVAEVDTGAALLEVTSPYPGTVRELHAEPGERVAAGKPLVSVSGPGAAGADEDPMDS